MTLVVFISGIHPLFYSPPARYPSLGRRGLREGGYSSSPERPGNLKGAK